jgi:NADH-quinone oxidoreductase subunit N
VHAVLTGWQAMLPSLVVVGVAVLAMIVDLIWREPDADGAAATGVLGLGVAMIVTLSLWGNPPVRGLAGTLVLDRFALFFALLACLAAALTILLSIEYVREQLISAGDYYVLVLLATSGMILMAAAGDLVVVFLALEVMSVAVYVLAGMLRGDVRSNEAALKYFLLGAFASGFLLYGIALVYGATGSTRLDVLAAVVAKGASPMLLGGVALLLVGLGFKVALAPFHAWAPDVYEGAPTSVTAFMAVGVKAAGFAALARVAVAALEPTALWQPLLWTLAVLTMTFGNVSALVQTSVKRLLAYSSIAHAGYALIGLVAGTPAGGGRAALLPRRLHLHERGRVRRAAGAQPQWRAQRAPERPVGGRTPASRARRGHDRLHAVARRHAAHRRLHRQVLSVLRRARRRLRVAGGDRGPEQPGVRGVLPGCAHPHVHAGRHA